MMNIFIHIKYLINKQNTLLNHHIHKQHVHYLINKQNKQTL